MIYNKISSTALGPISKLGQVGSRHVGLVNSFNSVKEYPTDD